MNFRVSIAGKVICEKH